MTKSRSESRPRAKRKFRLALVDDLTQDHIWKFHFTKLGLTAAVSSFVVLLFILLWCLVAFTPVRTLVPGYPDQKTRAAAATNAAKIDSLEYEITKWNLYSENFRRTLSGEDPLQLDSLFARLGQQRLLPLDADGLRESAAAIRSDVLSAENPQAQQEGTPRPLEELTFFAPVSGVLTAAFERNTHPGVDLTVSSGSPVHAVLDGTVILSEWEDEFGYTLVLQHAGDVLSIYRNCSALTRHRGDVVKAGTPVALTGTAVEAGERQAAFSFELWYRGTPLDPSLYILF